MNTTQDVYSQPKSVCSYVKLVQDTNSLFPAPCQKVSRDLPCYSLGYSPALLWIQSFEPRKSDLNTKLVVKARL